MTLGSLSTGLALLACAGLAFSQQQTFTPADIAGWEPHSFSGETHYELTTLNGQPAVHATCDNASASGLFYQGTIDLTETPVVEWTWWVEETYEGIDETVRAGDDYPARIYAVDEHRIAIWRTRAMNYVWASEQPEGSDWPNAYQSQAHMVAMRSGPGNAGEGQWVTERRNLRADFEQFHGRDLEELNAFAIMTDCDDTGRPSEAWYGGIRLLSADADS